MKVSIITVCLNSSETIESTIRSVLSQNYKNIEYIVIDGGSTDGTLEVLRRFKNRVSRFISECDRGIYHAMNKGIKICSGEIVGFLNSDDFYPNQSVIDTVVKAMEANNVDCCYGDIEYVARNEPGRIVRRWCSQPFSEDLFRKGWQPPHPTIFIKRDIFEKYGYFDIDFKISADYELMLRLLKKQKIKSCYIPEVLVRMRTGGKSGKNIWEIFKANVECYRSWRKNGFKVCPLIVFRKPLSKLRQLTRNI